MSGAEEQTVLDNLRSEPYRIDAEVIEKLLSLEPGTRKAYLSEPQAKYCEETRGECLLKIAANHGQFEIVSDFVNKVGFEIENTQQNEYNQLDCINRGYTELVELFASKIGAARDCLKTWMNMWDPEDGKVERILDVLMENGLKLELGKSRILFDSLPNNFNEMTVQTKILFQKGLAYTNEDISECALRKAAIWGKESVVELFLTGDSHTADEAASAYEILQIGSMRPKVMDVPLDERGLKYFRKAQKIRDEANVKRKNRPMNWKCFESMQDVTVLENQVSDGKMLEFVNQCYAICRAHDFSNEAFSDPLSIYDLQTWMFYYLDTYQDALSLYLVTDLDPRRFFHNKYKSAIARLLIECPQPNWQEVVMIFHTLKSMEYQSNAAVEIYRNIDLDVLKKTLESSYSPRVICTLLLSYVADIMQFTILEVLLEYVELLLVLGGEVTMTSREYKAAEEHLENLSTKKMWWLPPDELGYEKGEDAFDPTTLHRLVSVRSTWTQSSRFKLTIEAILNAACCQMDAQCFPLIKNRNFGVLRLKCLAAKKLPRSVCLKLPVALSHFVRKHR